MVNSNVMTAAILSSAAACGVFYFYMSNQPKPKVLKLKIKPPRSIIKPKREEETDSTWEKL